MTPFDSIPEDWLAATELKAGDPTLAALDAFLADQRARYDVYPPTDDVFAALRLTP